MSLIRCPECNKDVSSYAESCPHCGYPIRKPPFPKPSVSVNKAKKSKRFNDMERKKCILTIYARECAESCVNGSCKTS